MAGKARVPAANEVFRKDSLRKKARDVVRTKDIERPPPAMSLVKRWPIISDQAGSRRRRRQSVKRGSLTAAAKAAKSSGGAWGGHGGVSRVPGDGVSAQVSISRSSSTVGKEDWVPGRVTELLAARTAKAAA